MVDTVNDEDYDVVTPVFFLPCVLSLFVSSHPQNTFRKDHSTWMHSLLLVSRTDINEEDVVEDIIIA